MRKDPATQETLKGKDEIHFLLKDGYYLVVGIVWNIGSGGEGESGEAHVGCVHSQHHHLVASTNEGLNWGDGFGPALTTETIILHSATKEQEEDIHQVYFFSIKIKRIRSCVLVCLSLLLLS